MDGAVNVLQTFRRPGNSSFHDALVGKSAIGRLQLADSCGPLLPVLWLLRQAQRSMTFREIMLKARPGASSARCFGQYLIFPPAPFFKKIPLGPPFWGPRKAPSLAASAARHYSTTSNQYQAGKAIDGLGWREFEHLIGGGFFAGRATASNETGRKGGRRRNRSHPAQGRGKSNLVQCNIGVR